MAEDGAAPRLRRIFTPVRLVVAIGLPAITIAAIAILAGSAPRRAGTNLTADTGYVLPLDPGRQLCEPAELVPGDTAALRLNISSGAPQGPRLDLTMSNADGPVGVGGLAAGWRSGVLSIPVSRVRTTKQAVMICLVNRGTTRVAFGGSVPDSGFYVVIGGKPLSGRMRIEYMRPGSETWFSLLPTLVHRFSLAKADLVRHWAAGAVLVLMLIAIGLAARTIVREESPR
ncbi:MAG TPA: hypothetical protein VHW67_01335 [Solirubrobacteraceae bacterium]|nr:hypothetical protein [Solirubrobacteraceae bacterium]